MRLQIENAESELEAKLMTTKQTAEIQRLEARIEELANQVRQLGLRVGETASTGRAGWKEAASRWPADEEAQRVFRDVREIIQENREAGRREAAADYDRIHGGPAKRATRKAKTRKVG